MSSIKNGICGVINYQKQTKQKKNHLLLDYMQHLQNYILKEKKNKKKQTNKQKQTNKKKKHVIGQLVPVILPV